MYRTTLLFTFLLLFGEQILCAQVNDERIRALVLKKNMIGREFTFGKWTRNGDTESRLRYLGKVITDEGRTFKIMNSVWLWGLSCRATSRILIFNGQDKYLGNYYLTTSYDLPTHIKHQQLVFTNSDSNCDKRTTTYVSFKKGPPKDLFRKCKGNSGDIYGFSAQ